MLYARYNLLTSLVSENRGSIELLSHVLVLSVSHSLDRRRLIAKCARSTPSASVFKTADTLQVDRLQHLCLAILELRQNKPYFAQKACVNNDTQLR